MNDGPRPITLPARDAYRLWAPAYEAETAVTALEQVAANELSPPAAGAALMDAGCGTARRLPAHPSNGVGRYVGIDLVYEMLAAARHRRRRTAQLVAADVRALPFPPDTFDLIWCRLVLGHIEDLTLAYREFGAVSRSGTVLVVTDVHPAALSAEHLRTFRDAQGVLRAVETHRHSMADHEQAAHGAGFSLDARREWQVGPTIRRFYEEAHVLDRYERQCGMPLLLGLRFTRRD